MFESLLKRKANPLKLPYPPCYEAPIRWFPSRVGIGHVSDMDTLRYAIDTSKRIIEKELFESKK